MKADAGDPLPSDFDQAFAAARDHLAPLGRRILYFSSIGSTNDVAASLAAAGGAGGTVVIADEQTAGRGRRGRVWFSPPGSGLYVSIVVAPARSRGDPSRATRLLTLAAGVALSEGIESQTGMRPDIKWPNDLLVGRRKLAGILAEGIVPTPGSGAAMDPVSSVVLGYGINVGPMAYPPELSDRATSLESELGRPIDRAALCARTVVAVASRYRDLLEGRFDAILNAWRERARGSRGARVTWTSTEGLRSGTTEGIDDFGALLVRSGDAVERIVSGEVTWTW